MTRTTTAIALACFSMAGVLLADADYSLENEPQVGATCTEKDGFLLICYTGSRLLLIPGRVFTTDSKGVERPLRKAKFWRTDMPKPIRMKNPVGKNGKFKLDLGLDWASHLICQNGIVVKKERVGEAKIRVTAKGCKDRVVNITENTTGLSIEMDCVDR